jgi:hypothetical protein
MAEGCPGIAPDIRAPFRALLGAAAGVVEDNTPRAEPEKSAALQNNLTPGQQQLEIEHELLPRGLVPAASG